MSPRGSSWVDGRQEFALPLPDRGLEFGDGLFETLLLAHGRPLFPERHFRRLRRGLQRLHFPDCLPRVRELLAQATAELEQWQAPAVALRLTVTRGGGERGYAPPVAPVPRVVIAASELPDTVLEPPSPARVGLSSVRWSQQPLLAGIKHLNRLEQVLAATERQHLGFDEMVVLDQAGQVASVTAGNLFVVHDNQLLTAPVKDCGIAGTRRGLVMEYWAPRLGLTVREQHIQPELLGEAAELFYCNSLVGLRAVARFGARQWRHFPVTEALWACYREVLG